MTILRRVIRRGMIAASVTKLFRAHLPRSPEFPKEFHLCFDHVIVNFNCIGTLKYTIRYTVTKLDKKENIGKQFGPKKVYRKMNR